jgi:hypothetical protein
MVLSFDRVVIRVGGCRRGLAKLNCRFNGIIDDDATFAQLLTITNRWQILVALRKSAPTNDNLIGIPSLNCVSDWSIPFIRQRRWRVGDQSLVTESEGDADPVREVAAALPC